MTIIIDLVFDGTQTHCWVEDIDGLHGSLSRLLVAKDKVNPGVQVLGDMVALQYLAVLQDKETRILLGPWWQHHVVHWLPVLAHAKVEPWEGGGGGGGGGGGRRETFSLRPSGV